MDKRYSGMRFYNGVKASTNGKEKAERLLRSYMANVRKVNRQNEDYGGSTGGIKSAQSNQGLQVLKQRSARQADLRRIFQEEGTGRFGGRKEAWIAKQLDPDKRELMEDAQAGKTPSD